MECENWAQEEAIARKLHTSTGSCPPQDFPRLQKELNAERWPLINWGVYIVKQTSFLSEKWRSVKVSPKPGSILKRWRNGATSRIASSCQLKMQLGWIYSIPASHNGRWSRSWPHLDAGLRHGLALNWLKQNEGPASLTLWETADRRSCRVLRNRKATGSLRIKVWFNAALLDLWGFQQQAA